LSLATAGGALFDMMQDDAKLLHTPDTNWRLLLFFDKVVREYTDTNSKLLITIHRIRTAISILVANRLLIY
jgi:hypothetical protein